MRARARLANPIEFDRATRSARLLSAPSSACVQDTARNVVQEIDGAVQNLDRLRVSGAVGACTLPDDDIFGIPFDPVPHDCVADGYWALLSPLSVGSHTIHFAGGFASGFSLDVTHQITGVRSLVELSARERRLVR